MEGHNRTLEEMHLTEKAFQTKRRREALPMKTKIQQGQISDKHKAEMAVLQDEIPGLLFMQSLEELTPGVAKSIQDGTFAKCLAIFDSLLVSPDDSWVMRRFKAKAKVDARFLNMSLPEFNGDPFNYTKIDAYIEELRKEPEGQPDPDNPQLAPFDRLIGRTGRDERGKWIYKDGPGASWEKDLMEDYICELLHQNALADTCDSRHPDPYKRRYDIVSGINTSLVTVLAEHAVIEAKRQGLSEKDIALRNQISDSSVKALRDTTKRWEWWKSHAEAFAESVKEFSWARLFNTSKDT